MQARTDPTECEQALHCQKGILRRLSWTGALFFLSFLAISFLSPAFDYDSSLDRPILIVTGVLLLSSSIAFYGLITAIKIQTSNRDVRRQLTMLIIAVALGARLAALFSYPILEIDYYRYMWDGKVLAAGISPYHYAPEQILDAPVNVDGELRDLTSLAARSDSNHTILSRIHFARLTTLYPPVSQLVFSAAMSLMPETTSVEAHVLFIKFVLLLFDVGILLLVFSLFRSLNRHPGWLITYAWNPLVIKEIANSGHLDSIATFFTVLSAFAFIQWYRARPWRRSWLIASAVALACGVGSKLFPAVVFPLLLVAIFRKCKLSACVFALIFLVATGAALYPMFMSPAANYSVQNNDHQENNTDTTNNRFDKKAKAREGFTAFFSRWRMNDVVFSSLYLNLKDVQRGTKQPPWYVITSNEFRSNFCRWCKDNHLGSRDPAYSTTRVFTIGAFAIFYLCQLVMIYRSESDNDRYVTQLLSRTGWTIAVFLFLQPTVNPWYLLWMLPFCSFSSNRGWLLVSGMTLVYYSRFWFKSLSGSFEIGNATYSGTGLFDHFITWGEHFAMAAILLGFALAARRFQIGSKAH